MLAVLYDWHNERVLVSQAADVGFWQQRFCASRSVAVLGAGTGRVAWPLAGPGRTVLAVERDLARLGRIPAGCGVIRVCADFLSLPIVPASCQHVVFPYSTLQLVAPASLEACLTSAARILEGNGRLWIDVSDRFSRREDHPWTTVLDSWCPAIGMRIRERQRGVRQADHYRLVTRYYGAARLLAQTTERWYFHLDEDMRRSFAAVGLHVVSARRGYGSGGSRHRRVYELVVCTPPPIAAPTGVGEVPG